MTCLALPHCDICAESTGDRFFVCEEQWNEVKGLIEKMIRASAPDVTWTLCRQVTVHG